MQGVCITHVCPCWGRATESIRSEITRKDEISGSVNCMLATLLTRMPASSKEAMGAWVNAAAAQALKVSPTMECGHHRCIAKKTLSLQTIRVSPKKDNKAAPT